MGIGSADFLRDIHDSTGVRMLLYADWHGQSAEEARDLAKALGPEIVTGVESANEPDFRGGNWVHETRQLQEHLWNVFKSDPATANLPVAGPSLTSPNAASAVGDISGWLDRANLHNYGGGRNPETGGWGSNGYGSVDWSLTYIKQPVAGSKPWISTECGYNTCWTITDGHVGIPEDVMAIYMPRLYLHFFNRGWTRVYTYQFWDQGSDADDPEHYFGFLRHDGSPKPHFHAVKNLIAVLNDPGDSFTPEALDYALSGNTANVHQTLLQKRDGTFYLVLWLGVSCWDVDPKIRTYPEAQMVGVRLPPGIAAAAVCYPNDGQTWSDLALSNGEISVQVRDNVAILRLERSGGSRGSYSASSAPVASEGPEKAFDGVAGTKWLGNFSGTAWLRNDLPNGQFRVVTQYSITSANDAPERDPKSWVLEGSNNGSSWTTLDSRSDQSFPARFHTRTYAIASAGAYRAFRLRITEIAGAASLTQLSELQWVFRTGIGNETIYELAPVHATDKRLDVRGLSTAAGANIHIWNDLDASNQRWKAIDVGGGYFEFEPVHAAGMRLDVSGSGTTNGTNVQIWSSNGTPAQRWKAISVGDGVFEFEPQCAPGMRLDVSGSGASNGTNVQIWTSNSTDAQRWTAHIVVGESYGEWSQRVFGGSVSHIADADGDGKTNYEEYVAGTDPQNCASHLFVLPRVPSSEGGMALSWDSVNGKFYSVERSTDLQTWTTLASNIPGTNAELYFADPLTSGNSSLFYRVTVRDPFVVPPES
jgi:hypothetical protein